MALIAGESRSVAGIGAVTDADGRLVTTNKGGLPATIDNTGAWGYKAGTAGTPTLTGKRVASISCVAGGTGGTVTINGGDTVVLAANQPFSQEIHGSLVAPVIVFTTTAGYFVETIG